MYFRYVTVLATNQADSKWQPYWCNRQLIRIEQNNELLVVSNSYCRDHKWYKKLGRWRKAVKNQNIVGPRTPSEAKIMKGIVLSGKKTGPSCKVDDLESKLKVWLVQQRKEKKIIIL
jgi:hypothetical protein